MERSMRWARRCRDHYHAEPAPGALFGIVQGGMYADLRQRSLDGLLEIDAEAPGSIAGLAIGGLAVGEPEPRAPAGARHAAAADARGAAPLPDGRRPPRGHRGRPSSAGWTCSTA